MICTVHITIVEDIAGDLAASAVVSSETITSTFAATEAEDTNQFHYFFLESAVAYTITDIEIENTLDADLNGGDDRVEISVFRALPTSYANTAAGFNDAQSDLVVKDLCHICSTDLINGDDTVDTLIISVMAFENQDDNGDHEFPLGFGPNTTVFIQLKHNKSTNDAGDISSTITYYLSGPQASDVTITELANQESQGG